MNNTWNNGSFNIQSNEQVTLGHVNLALTIPNDYSAASDFAKLVEKSWYVDKTLLIKAIFDDMDRIQLSAPCYFGKTTNLSMLKTFFEIEVDPDGEQIKLQKDMAGHLMEEQPLSKNFNLFRNTKVFSLQERTPVRRVFDKIFFTNHFGRYPTIWASFKNVKGDTYDKILDSLRTVIHDSFMPHRYLQKYYNISKYIDESQQLSEEEIHKSLKHLSTILRNEFGNDKKVFVLIDDVDAPISNAMYNKNVSELDLKKTISIISNLISRLLKDNPNVDMAFLTACLHVGDLLSPNNIVHHSSIQSRNFSDFYGFTENEVQDLFTKRRLGRTIHEAKEWYSNGVNSLRVCPSYPISPVHNPWSIVNSFRNKEKLNFWSSEIFNKLFVSLFEDEIPVKVEALMRQQLVTVKYKEQLGESDIIALKQIINNDGIIKNEKELSLIFQFLSENGYLSTLCRREGVLQLKMPNKEVLTEVCQSLFSINFFKKYYKIDQSTIDTFSESVSFLARYKNEEAIIQLAKSIKDLFNNGELLTQTDFEFRAFLFYLLSETFENTRGMGLTQQKKTGDYDIVVIIENETGIVIEIKIFDNGNSLVALDDLLDYEAHLILEDESINEKIFLGIHMSKSKNISISYLINDDQIHLARTVCTVIQ